MKSMRPVLLVLWVAALVSGWGWAKEPARGAQVCTTLFFSEYVEGSSHNKGVEIFNGLGRDVDLAGYEIRIYRNGGSDFDRQIPLSGGLASGDVFVVAHSAAAFDADLKTGGLDFNGDDGVALVKEGVIIDFIGDTLGDPGSEWGSGDASTKDNTLRRKSWVTAGDANPNDPFDPAAQWDGFPKDAFDGLGWHVAECTAPAGSPTPTQIASPAPTPTATPSPMPTASPTPLPQSVFINEYMPAPPTGQKEYIELYNANAFPVDLSDWQLDDMEGGTRPYTIPAGSIVPPRGHILFQRNFGLNNGGDHVRLLAPDGSLRDSHAYDHARKGGAWSRQGDGAVAWTEKYPPSPGQPNRAAVLDFSGHLYQGAPPDRSQPLADHNIGLYGFDNPDQSDARWLVNGYVRGDGGYTIHFDTAQGLYLYYMLRPAPRPGFTWSGVSSPNGEMLPPDRIRFTVPASGAYPHNDFWMAPLPPSPTPLPSPFVVLNEIMPAPKTIDFDGDGEANYLDEYIELYNPTDAPIDLGGWWLDDRPDGGSSPWRMPDETVIPARGFLLFFRKDTGIALNNDADSVRLLAPDRTVEADRFHYDRTKGDTPWSRDEDGVGSWTDAYPPSPGGPNLPPAETPTPTPTATLVITSTPTITPTPTISPTPTPLPTPVPAGFIALNEFLPAPKTIDFNGDGEANLLDEYIELYNPNAFPVSLAGWALDDRAEGGSRPWPLPDDAVIPARGFLLFFRAETGIALNNNRDAVRLLAPGGQEVDAFAYNQTAADTPWSRVEDGVGGWTMLYPPSPGGPNIAPTPTPTPLPPPPSDQIALNEVLPAPKNKDWDGDGVASYLDEWIELAYWGDRPVEISGWRLWRGPLGDDGLPTGYYYEFPAHTIIQPHSFPLIFRRQSKLALPASRGILHLVRPDGDGWQVVDAFAWRSFPDYDRSFSRYPDGTGSWLRIFVTPGQPNRPFPTPPPAPPPSSQPSDVIPSGPTQPIQAAYQVPVESRLTVEGVITVPPGVFHPRVVVIQDASAGIMVYLRRGQYPALAEGDRVRASGYLKDFHGQRELVLPSPKGITRLGSGTPVEPLFLRTGLVADAHMARLLRVAGKVTRVEQEGVWLDDGSGPILVQPPFRASWRLPKLERGMTLSAIGALSRYDDRLFIQLRRPADLSPPPGVLPVTGGAREARLPYKMHERYPVFSFQCSVFGGRP